MPVVRWSIGHCRRPSSMPMGAGRRDLLNRRRRNVTTRLSRHIGPRLLVDSDPTTVKRVSTRINLIFIRAYLRRIDQVNRRRPNYTRIAARRLDQLTRCRSNYSVDV